MEEIVNTIIELAELEECHRIVKPLETLKIVLIKQEIVESARKELVDVLTEHISKQKELIVILEENYSRAIDRITELKTAET